MNTKQGILLVGITLLLFCVFFIGTASAETWYVDDDGSADFTNIQDAINNASNGDTIIVRNGSYYECVVIDKTLKLIGEGAPTIDAQGLSDAVRITADSCVVSGFRCINGGDIFHEFHGMKIESDWNLIEDNTCENNANGICLHSHNYNKVIRNIYKNNHYKGICLDGSADYNWVMDNICEDNGEDGINVYVISSSNNEIVNNTCQNNSYGIYLYDSDHNNITNNICMNNSYGIRLYSSSYYNNIANNTCEVNNYGIYLDYSDDNAISSNICNNNNYSIYLSYGSSGNEITNNICYKSNYYGIYLKYSGYSSNYAANNTCNNNSVGIYLNSDNNDIEKNTCEDNGVGIRLNGADNNEITNNTCKSNLHGIYSENSDSNKVYLNNFYDNDENVNSGLSDNIWNSTEKINYVYKGKTYEGYMGNYWDDYTGFDENGDGIGDTPYDIYEMFIGSKDDFDNYPLIERFESYFAPEENQPPIASFIYSPEKPVVNQTITFNASHSYDPDGNITNYTWDFGDGNNTNTTEPIITHFYASAGTYNINLTVTDDDRVINSTTEMITIYPPTAIFDTGSGTYPSIFGTHNGTIKPNQTITVNTLYTYPCSGTGGHTEFIELYKNGIPIANGTWNGYQGDYHNITIHNVTGGTPYVTLLENHEYNYTIITGSYPQIHHNRTLKTTNGWINCTEFEDANGKKYDNWIPAIKLE